MVAERAPYELAGDQVDGINTDGVRDPFKDKEGDVPLAPFESTDVSSVHTQHLSEGFLREPSTGAMTAQVLADATLEGSFNHRGSVIACYL